METALVMFFVCLVLVAAMIFGLVMLIRYIIRYYTNMKKKKTSQQEEMDRMKIDDL